MIWHRNKDGFKFISAEEKSRKGVIVCTDQVIYFSIWNASSGYSTEFYVVYDQIEMLRHAANEIFGCVGIKKDNFNSVEILGDQEKSPYLPSKEQTEITYKII